jgi:hypothetical protein
VHRKLEHAVTLAVQQTEEYWSRSDKKLINKTSKHRAAEWLFINGLKLENKGTGIATKYELHNKIIYGREASGFCCGLLSRGSELCEDLKCMGPDHGLEPM